MRADGNTTVEHIQEPVVRIRQLLIESSTRLQAKVDQRHRDVIVRGCAHGSGASTVDTRLGTILSSQRHSIARDLLESRGRPAGIVRQRQPQLKYAALPQRNDVLIVDDSAPRCHPQHVSGLERSFVAITKLALDDECHGLEPAVRVRAPGLTSRLEIDTVIHQHDERIVLLEFVGIDDGDRSMSFADEARRWTRRCRDASDFALRHGHALAVTAGRRRSARLRKPPATPNTSTIHVKPADQRPANPSNASTE